MRSYGKHEAHKPSEERSRRCSRSIIGKILMLIGLMTVLYILITYVIIPILAAFPSK